MTTQKKNLKVVASNGKTSGKKSTAKVAVVTGGKSKPAPVKVTVQAKVAGRPGSRKGKVREFFAKNGREKAFAFGKSLKLKESTLKQWLNTWAREQKAA